MRALRELGSSSYKINDIHVILANYENLSSNIYKKVWAFCQHSIAWEGHLSETLSFFYRKTIEIPIMEEDSYEKNVVMYVVIGEPRHIAGNFHTS